MLDIFKSFGHGIWYYFACVFVLGGASPAFTTQDTQHEAQACKSYYEYYTEFFNSINENTNMDEVVDNLIFLRQSIINHGVQCATLREMGGDLIRIIYGHKICPESAILKEFIERIERREVELSQSYARPQVHLSHKKKDKSKRHKPEKELKINGRTICGFVSTLAGGLVSIVPGCQAVGVGLVVYGVSQMMEGVISQGEENEREHKANEQRRREEEILKEPALQ